MKSSMTTEKMIEMTEKQIELLERWNDALGGCRVPDNVASSRAE